MICLFILKYLRAVGIVFINKMCDNVQNCCRICLDVESDHVSILEDPVIQLHLKSCLGIIVGNNSELPRSVCVSCVSKLSGFYNFQINARCSQDWLESCIQEKSEKASEYKTPIQPLPDSEYNSDSLLEFLNNTANIDEYLSNLGKEDIPAIVNMLDRNNENSMDSVDKLTSNLKPKLPSPKKRQVTKTKNCNINMEIDVLDSELDIVKEILSKEVEPKTKPKNTEKSQSCFSCKAKFESLQKLAQHLSICDTAQRTCTTCNLLFDSKHKMIQHRITHVTTLPTTCNCGKLFASKEHLAIHYKYCFMDYTASLGCSYRCKQCNSIFSNRSQLYKHAKEHVLAKNRICDICGLSFLGDAALEIHKKEHTKPAVASYRCKVCSYTTKDRRDVYQHIMRHTKLPAPGHHLCESCGKSFTSHFTLKRHSMTHINGKSKELNSIIHHCDSFKAEKQVCDIEKGMCERCGELINNFMLNLHTCIVKCKEE